ncbi:uncharacterized protein LOC115214179, partial [Argonauta hians]
LILATSWEISLEKISVHENTACIWQRWPSFLQPVLYTSTLYKQHLNTYRLSMYLSNSWEINKIPKVACNQVPVLKSMMLDILASFPNSDYYGYANSDILFDDSLIKTLKAIKESIPTNTPILIIGQRTNVNVTSLGHIEYPNLISKIAKTGELMKGIAIDYFITNRHFPWNLVLDLVIGRIYYDNWLVHFSIEQNVTVIDATNTLLAVHQTTSDGNNAGWKHLNKYCNRHIIAARGKQFKTRWGYTWCAPYYTKPNTKKNTVDIVTRTVSLGCKPYIDA